MSVKPDVIILGQGRSGTSFAARVLPEHFGVCFGQRIDPRPQGAMESGKWEDQNMKSWNKALAMMKITPEEWLSQFDKAHRQCRKIGHLGDKQKLCFHGVKDPHLSFVPLLAFKHIKPGLIVEASRSKGQVLHSRKHNAPWRSLIYWAWHTEAALHNLQCIHLAALEWDIPYVRLDFTERRSEKYVIDAIGDKLTRPEGSEE